MPTTTFVLPGTATNLDNGGSAWSTPNNALTDNGTYTTCSTDGTSTDYLVLNNMSFSGVPDDAIIFGIQVEADIKAWNDKSTGTQTLYFALTDDGTTIDTANKKTETYTVDASSVSGATATKYSLGSESDKWGKNLMGKDINDSTTFGCVVYADKGPASNKDAVGVDYASVSITWQALSGMIGDI